MKTYTVIFWGDDDEPIPDLTIKIRGKGLTMGKLNRMVRRKGKKIPGVFAAQVFGSGPSGGTILFFSYWKSLNRNSTRPS